MMPYLNGKVTVERLIEEQKPQLIEEQKRQLIKGTKRLLADILKKNPQTTY